MTRSSNEAIAYAREHRTNEPGMCLATVRGWYGVSALYPTASAGWQGAEFKHRVNSGSQTPRGSIVWWTGGSHGFGHVALATGNGACWSTDAGGWGHVAKVNIDDLTRRWGLNFQGWTADINGVRVWTPPDRGAADGKKIVRLSLLKPGKRNADVHDLKVVLKDRMPRQTDHLVDDDHFGRGLRRAYSEWQHRCGFRGQAANGIPGRTSLQRLGFKVL